MRRWENLAGRGSKIIFVEGNHEFGLSQLSWSGVEVILKQNFEMELSDGKFLRFTHGDLLSKDLPYRAFRAMTKSKQCLSFARILPGSVLDGYTLKHASVSRSMNRPVDHIKVLGNAVNWARENFPDSPSYHIFGHYHVPYADRVSGRNLLCLPCWDDRPNFLGYRASHFCRWFWSSAGDQWIKSDLKRVLQSGFSEEII